MKYSDKEKIEKANNLCYHIHMMDKAFEEVAEIEKDIQIKEVDAYLKYKDNKAYHDRTDAFVSVTYVLRPGITKDMIIKGYRALLSSVEKDLKDELEKL